MWQFWRYHTELEIDADVDMQIQKGRVVYNSTINTLKTHWKMQISISWRKTFGYQQAYEITLNIIIYQGDAI